MKFAAGSQQPVQRSVTVRVVGMGCPACVRLVTGRLRDVAGVRVLTADADRSTVDVHGSMTVDQVLAALTDLDFAIEVLAE